MPILLFILAATFLIALLALSGILVLSLKEEFLNSILLKLVAFSSGALLGGAFIHLIPEGLEKNDPESFFFVVLVALIVYLFIEKILHWRHCHKGPDCPVHSFGYMNLIGDSVHNFIDGVIIASSFIVSVPLGIATTLAIALHEIPQEIGDFGVLVYAGFPKSKAVVLNFAVACSVIVGGIVGWALFFYVENITAFLLPVAAGGFIYIALSDMIPELRKENSLKNFLTNLGVLILGVVLMLAVKLFGVE